jgi:hypothetical protein
MGVPAGWFGVLRSWAFQMLHAYKIPRHKFTTTPAPVTTHP